MKNLKLGKWGVGLQKSMFEYDKDTYLKDKLAADEVVQLMGDDLEDEKKDEDIEEYQALYQGADYIFIGSDEEEEFAEIMGVELYDADKEPKAQKAKLVALTKEQIAIHHENIADIREGLAKFMKD